MTLPSGAEIVYDAPGVGFVDIVPDTLIVAILYSFRVFISLMNS